MSSPRVKKWATTTDRSLRRRRVSAVLVLYVASAMPLVCDAGTAAAYVRRGAAPPLAGRVAYADQLPVDDRVRLAAAFEARAVDGRIGLAAPAASWVSK